VIVGDILGGMLGIALGSWLGVPVGLAEGVPVGSIDGLADGTPDDDQQEKEKSRKTSHEYVEKSPLEAKE